MLLTWLQNGLILARKPSPIRGGPRKIHLNVSLTFEDLGEDLTIEHGFYTSAKLKALRRLYHHEESFSIARRLWKRRTSFNRYGSVGFTTYNHITKGEDISYFGNVNGPCMQAVTLTQVPSKGVAVDVFYRSTEYYKKFVADLVFLRDVLLEPFEIGGSLLQVTFHFAAITCHPMYFLTLLPLMEHPIAELSIIGERDPLFYKNIIKYLAEFVCPEYRRGADKFHEALKLEKDLNQRMTNGRLDTIARYIRQFPPEYLKPYSPKD